MAKKRIKTSASDRVFYAVVYAVMVFIALIVLIPLLHVFSSSFSNPSAVTQGKVFLLPKGLSLEGYKAVFRDDSIMRGYTNTIFYTVAGTLLNVSMTIICAYPLSRKDLPGRGPLMFFFTFTMMFSGGLIPGYLLVRDLKMINTVWALLIPSMMTVYNMVVARSFFENSIPHEILEATKIDGGNDFVYFFKILLPLSKSVIAVLMLYYAVASWNSYFFAFLYLNDESKFPLQLVLREILIKNEITSEMADGASVVANDLSGVLKYASIIVASLPIWIIYPLVQRHFVKGMTVGAVKG